MTKDEIAKLMNDTAGQHWGDEAHFQRFANMLLAAEREACAKVCDEISEEYGRREARRYPGLRTDAEMGADVCAVAIRARRNK
jgi:hypothetical protein